MLQTLSIILGILALLFAVFLFTVKTKNRLGNTLLGLYFLIMAIDFSAYISIDIAVSLAMFRNDFASLTSRPLIYLYVLSVIYSDFRLRKKHLLHLIWLAVDLVIMLPIYLEDKSKQIEFFSNYLDFPQGQFLMPFTMAHTQFYLVLIFVTLIRYRKKLFQNFSNPNLKNYKWLMQMTVMLQILFLFVFLKNILRTFSYDFSIVENSRIAMLLFIIFFLCWLLMKALHAPEIFRGIDSKLKLFKDVTEDEKKKSAEDEKVEGLKTYMKEKEPYLNANLTIQNLANQMNLPVRELSVLINIHFRQHFYDFINSYRIEKAKELLKDSSKQDLMVFEVFYDVGFNSKSSFNTAFKKHVGLTPTQYRKAN